MKAIASILFALSTLCFTACDTNKDNNNATPDIVIVQGSPSPTPSVSPTPSATPSVTPTPTPTPVVREWRSMFREQISDVQVGCDNPLRFTIQHNGSYQAGPCHHNGNDFETGKITDSEMVELEGRAHLLLNNNYLQRFCKHAMPTNSTMLRMTLINGAVFTMFQRSQDNQQECYRDGYDRSKALDASMDTLMQKYYPSAGNP